MNFAFLVTMLSFVLSKGLRYHPSSSSKAWGAYITPSRHSALMSTNNWNRNGDMSGMSQVPRIDTPVRNDVCKLLVSGIIGTDPRDVYLANGHYVINFAVAVVGHFDAAHQGEQSKPAQTMWITSEIWDDEARSNSERLRKGSFVTGIGRLISNKWIDKNSGEERKQFKLRITKVLPVDEFRHLNELMNDAERTSMKGMSEYSPDSAFSPDFPPMEDQSLDAPTYSSNEPFEVQMMRHQQSSQPQVQPQQAWQNQLDNRGSWSKPDWAQPTAAPEAPEAPPAPATPAATATPEAPPAPAVPEAPPAPEIPRAPISGDISKVTSAIQQNDSNMADEAQENDALLPISEYPTWDSVEDQLQQQLQMEQGGGLGGSALAGGKVDDGDNSFSGWYERHQQSKK